MKTFILLLLLTLAPVWAEPVRKIPASQIDQVRKQVHPFLLDVRDPDEVHDTGTLEGSLNIPVDQLEKRLSEVPRDKKILVFCEGGYRAAQAAEVLQKHGYSVTASCGLHEYKGPRVKP